MLRREITVTKAVVIEKLHNQFHWGDPVNYFRPLFLISPTTSVLEKEEETTSLESYVSLEAA